MKRLLLIAVFALLPVAVFAQADRDVLVTPEGTLYSVESTVNDGSASIQATQYLRLTIQRGNDKPETLSVPDSLTAGFHWRPALAYDTDSKTLFVLWLKMPNGMSSELMLSSYSNGRWQPAISIDSQTYRLRFNLRVNVTHRISKLQKDGTYADAQGLLVHTVWWEQTGFDEMGRYALVAIEKGAVSSMEVHNLNEFAPSPGILANPVDPTFNPEILKHPSFADSGSLNSVDVVFGDIHMNTFTRVNIRPIADGRIHIPIGARPGGPRFPAPKSFSADWNGRISTIPSKDGKLLLYNTTASTVSYVMYDAGAWSTVKTLPLNDRFSAEAAVAALTRMMNE